MNHTGKTWIDVSRIRENVRKIYRVEFAIKRLEVLKANTTLDANVLSLVRAANILNSLLPYFNDTALKSRVYETVDPTILRLDPIVLRNTRATFLSVLQARKNT